MIKTIKIKEKLSVDLSAYVNTGTGECLSSEICDGASVSIVRGTTKSIVSYSDYCVVSKDAIDFLMGCLSDNDFGRIYRLSITLKTPMNILFNGHQPHNNKTLQEYLGFNSRSKYSAFISRVIKVGVLAKGKGVVDGRSGIIYSMNPYVCRRGNNFDNRVLAVFEKFAKDNEK